MVVSSYVTEHDRIGVPKMTVPSRDGEHNRPGLSKLMCLSEEPMQQTGFREIRATFSIIYVRIWASRLSFPFKVSLDFKLD